MGLRKEQDKGHTETLRRRYQVFGKELVHQDSSNKNTTLTVEASNQFFQFRRLNSIVTAQEHPHKEGSNLSSPSPKGKAMEIILAAPHPIVLESKHGACVQSTHRSTG